MRALAVLVAFFITLAGAALGIRGFSIGDPIAGLMAIVCAATLLAIPYSMWRLS